VNRENKQIKRKKDINAQKDKILQSKRTPQNIEIIKEEGDIKEGRECSEKD